MKTFTIEQQVAAVKDTDIVILSVEADEKETLTLYIPKSSLPEAAVPYIFCPREDEEEMYPEGTIGDSHGFANFTVFMK